MELEVERAVSSMTAEMSTPRIDLAPQERRG